MKPLTYMWKNGAAPCVLELAYVEGTKGSPFLFGEGAESRSMEVPSFHVATVPVTQGLWEHVLGCVANPAVNRGTDLPVENVSWDQINEAAGFLERINHSQILPVVLAQLPAAAGAFRLPTEAEWEYAARGGRHWRDGFRFSGSNAIDEVAWYERRHGDHTQPVAQKAPNQLGIYDMSGNVWEWCQDAFTRDVVQIPGNGTPFVGPSAERVLRGGCFHNWAIHCTVFKRYEIARDYRDGCIGFRLVFSVADVPVAG
jgi:formylglycine-generating enzyme required for sulfatase activity